MASRIRERPGRRSTTIQVTVTSTASPVEAAADAGLRYVNDSHAGIRRVTHGRSFRYLAPDGTPVQKRDALVRIRSLAIPPAWTDVWICPTPDGHIQATGRDARRRKQYRYHARWSACRDETKYHKLIAFGRALPRIRKRVEKDLARHGLPREKVLAAVTQLLETTFIRVGNEEYRRQNGSVGLTTMRDEHVQVKGKSIRFRFKGKSGVLHEIGLQDRRLARIIRSCQDLPGRELFQYVDEKGIQHDVDSSHVNDYLREVAGEEFTAKDFRTWAGTVLAAKALSGRGLPTSKTAAQKNIAQAIAEVARELGNTRAVCRRCYVHPAVLEAYSDGSLIDGLASAAPVRTPAGLQREEACVLGFLEAREK